MDHFPAEGLSPEQHTANAELRRVLENAIEALPQLYRCVFMLRDVEQMSIEDVSRVLNLSESTVKVRLHRARRVLRKAILASTGKQVAVAFPFDAVRCDRVVAAVFGRISPSVMR